MKAKRNRPSVAGANDQSALVEASIQKIAEFYSLGQMPRDKRHDSPLLKNMKELSRIENLEKAGHFVDRFSQSELERLFKDARSGQFIITKGHVLKLLTVQAADERTKIQGEMIKGRWSVQMLRERVDLKLGRNSPGGRPTRLDSLEHGVYALLTALERADRLVSRTLDLATNKNERRPLVSASKTIAAALKKVSSTGNLLRKKHGPGKSAQA